MNLSSRDPDLAATVPMRLLAAFGAAGCAVAVATGAYTMHGALSSQNREFLGMAALFLFLNGLGLAALAPSSRSRVRKSGLFVILFGTLLFVGSLAGAALFGFRPMFAPLGGSLLIFGWLIMAAGFLFE